MARATIDLKKADKIRNGQVQALEREIQSMYNDLAKKLRVKAANAANASTWSKRRQAAYLQDLATAIEKESLIISLRLKTGLSEVMTEAAMAVVDSNNQFLKKVGFDVTSAFSKVPREVVRSIVSGSVYEEGWNLSRRIWGAHDDTLKRVYRIIGEGVTENRTLKSIATDLESYVRPSARKASKVIKWVDAAGKTQRFYPGKIDYNAQRLVRTLTQHAYQQTVQITSVRNPWVQGIKWNSTGSRVCPLCASRDGEIFKPDQLPMDHPNGMCTFEPVLEKSFDAIADEVADWYRSPEGTYPGIDAYSKYF